MDESVDDFSWSQRPRFHIAELTTYLALVFDAPVNRLLTISAKLSNDSGFAGTENVSANLETYGWDMSYN